MLNVFIHKLGVDASIRKEKCRVNVFIPKNKGVNVSVDNKQKQRVSIFIKKEERRVFILKEQLRETVLIQKLKGPKSCNLTTCLNCCNCIHFADIYIYIYITRYKYTQRKGKQVARVLPGRCTTLWRVQWGSTIPQHTQTTNLFLTSLLTSTFLLHWGEQSLYHIKCKHKQINVHAVIYICT